MIVEDNDNDLKVCRDSIDVYEQKKRDENIELMFHLTQCKTVDDAINKIDGSFDGVIVDLKFPEKDDRGKDLLDLIKKSFLRIPVIILTGTPDNIEDERKFELIKILKKGEADYQLDILDVFLEIYNTGLTKIMGGRGCIEQRLNDVFLKNILPQLDVWKSYGKIDISKTEKAMLRFTLSHLLQLIEDDNDQCFPEEMYIYPPFTDYIRTGSITRKKENNKFYIVLNPACDLVIRQNNQINTDRILLVEIDEEKTVCGHIINKLNSDEEKREKINIIFNNRHTLYHHWLPKTNFFQGGFINFRKLSTITKKEFRKKFNNPYIQISPNFIKDILSRFSSYYSRQGQPDIKKENVVEETITSLGKIK